MRRVLPLMFALAACGRIGFADRFDAAGGADGNAAACPPNVILCDDFETGDTTKWSEQGMSAGAMLTVSGAQPHAGRFSLDGNVPMLSDGAFASVGTTFPLHTTGVLAARLWSMAPNSFTRFDTVVRFWHAPTNHYILIACSSSNLWAATENDGVGIIDHFTTTPCGPSPIWHCVELVYMLDARRAQLYVDGTLALDQPMFDSAPQFSRVDVGAVRADAAGFRVFVDDVVIAEQRVGCQ